MDSFSLNRFSASIHETSIIESVGIFTAFVDGRVRVRFFDRTILEMSAKQNPSICEFLLPNGDEITINSDEPLTFGWFVPNTLIL